MYDETTLVQEWRKKGYKDLGVANMNLAAARAIQGSKDQQSFRIGRNYDFIVCHDLKVFARLDSGD